MFPHSKQLLWTYFAHLPDTGCISAEEKEILLRFQRERKRINKNQELAVSTLSRIPIIQSTKLAFVNRTYFFPYNQRTMQALPEGRSSSMRIIT